MPRIPNPPPSSRFGVAGKDDAFSSASQRIPVTAIRADYEFAKAFYTPTAALIGTAPALEAQAIASPAARLRKKSVLRMDTSSGVPSATTALPFASRCCSEARVYAQCPAD